METVFQAQNQTKETYFHMVYFFSVKVVPIYCMYTYCIIINEVGWLESGLFTDGLFYHSNWDVNV